MRDRRGRRIRAYQELRYQRYGSGGEAALAALADAIGARNLTYYGDAGPGGSGPCAMVAQAVGAIMSGQADTVVVFRSRNGRSGNRFGLSSDLARATGGGESMIEFYGPYGLLSPGQFFALRAAVAYVAERVQFGRKFVSFPAIKHRCADVAIAVDDARSAAIHAVSAVQEGGDALRSARGGSVRTGLPGGCQGERPSAWRGRFHVGTLRPLVFSACDQ